MQIPVELEAGQIGQLHAFSLSPFLDLIRNMLIHSAQNIGLNLDEENLEIFNEMRNKKMITSILVQDRNLTDDFIKTAEALQIHVETLRYRLNKVQTLTNCSTDSSEGLFILQMTAKLKNIIRKRHIVPVPSLFLLSAWIGRLIDLILKESTTASAVPRQKHLVSWLFMSQGDPGVSLWYVVEFRIFYLFWLGKIFET